MLGKILKRYLNFREAQKYLQEALRMTVNGECDRYWLDSCVEMFEMMKEKIRKGWE